MHSKRWDRKYMELARHVSSWSHDPSTKVGAVLVNYELGMEFIGYNGFPRWVEDTPERYADRKLKYAFMVHAEVNAILKAGRYAKGGSLYIYPSFAIPPICSECAKVAIQSGVSEIVGFDAENNERAERWKDSIEIARIMLQESGVSWRVV